jgi:hypothetical protein
MYLKTALDLCKCNNGILFVHSGVFLSVGFIVWRQQIKQIHRYFSTLLNTRFSYNSFFTLFLLRVSIEHGEATIHSTEKEHWNKLTIPRIGYDSPFLFYIMTFISYLVLQPIITHNSQRRPPNNKTARISAFTGYGALVILTV